MFHGMDTAQVLDESEALERAARRLEGVMDGLHTSVHAVEWVGPDADAFREQWGAVRRQGEGIVVPELGDRSRELQHHVEEQEQASSVEGEGWFDQALDWLRDAGGDLVDGIRDGIGWAGDRLSNGMEWLGDRFQDGRDAIGTAIAAIRDVEWPSLSEMLVGDLTLKAFLLGEGLGALTGQDLKWAVDGTGYADAPVPVTPGESGLVPPGDLSQIIANTNQTYGDKETGEVSMTVVGNPPTGVIVNIPGTEKWGPGAGDNPMDLTGNAWQAGPNGWSAGSEATADAISQLYEQHDIPPGTPLMLNGHSQGGMIASSLAANEDFASQFNVTNVMTYGAPVDNYDVPADVNQLNIQHRLDVVPRIDLGGHGLGPGGGGGDHATTITLQSPSLLNPVTNHSSAEYQESVQTQLQDPGSALSQYSQDLSFAPFFEGDAGSVQHYVSGVHRDN